MRIFSLTVIMLYILAACQKKAVPVITDRNVSPPKIKKTVYPPVANVPIDNEKGKSLYTTACARCHELPVTTSFNQKEWDGYLASMFPRTNLSQEQAYQIRAWVMANAKQ